MSTRYQWQQPLSRTTEIISISSDESDNEIISISSDDSETEIDSDAKMAWSSSKKTVRYKHPEDYRRPKSLIRETPYRQQQQRNPPSSDSMSMKSLIFDLDPNAPETPETPLTPPLSQLTTSSDAKRSAVKIPKTPPLFLYSEKTSKVNQPPMAGYFGAKPPSLPYRPISNLPVEHTSTAEEEDIIPGFADLSLDDRDSDQKPPRGGIVQRDRSPYESLGSPVPTSKPGRKAKPLSRNNRTRDEASPSPTILSSSTRDIIDHEWSISHNKRDRIIPPVIRLESEVIPEDDSEVPVENISVPEEGGSPSKCHQRSKSAPELRTAEVKNTEAGLSNAQAEEDLPSSPKSKKQTSSQTSRASVATGKTRRSTGSIPKAPRPPLVIERSDQRSDELDPDIPTSEPARACSSEEILTPRIPNFTRHEEKYVLECDVRDKILGAIQPKVDKTRKGDGKGKGNGKGKVDGKGKEDFWIWAWKLNAWFRQLSNPEDVKDYFRSWIWRPNTWFRQFSNPEDDKDGYVYIFKCPEFEHFTPGHLKIGQTKKDKSKRIKEWEGRCKIVAEHIEDENSKRFRHYEIVEKIVHAELCNERRNYKCWCNTQHRLPVAVGVREEKGHQEWFKVGEERALQTVVEWREWCIRRKPYHSDGTLRACWRWKCEQAKKTNKVDWVAFREFGWFEICKCCMHRLSEFGGKVWPRGMRLDLCPELFILVIAGGLSVCLAGASLSSCYIFLVIVALYILAWFNYA